MITARATFQLGAILALEVVVESVKDRTFQG